MSLEQSRAKVIANIWQAVAQSGVDLSALPREQLNKLVDVVADSVLLTVNEQLDVDGTPAKAIAAADPIVGDEQTLWEGRPFLSLTEYYVITSQRVRIIRGLLSRDREDIELIRIQDLDQSQNFGERMINVGDITMKTSDTSSPNIVLRNVADPQAVHEILRHAWIEAREHNRVGFREQL